MNVNKIWLYLDMNTVIHASWNIYTYVYVCMKINHVRVTGYFSFSRTHPNPPTYE